MNKAFMNEYSIEKMKKEVDRYERDTKDSFESRGTLSYKNSNISYNKGGKDAVFESLGEYIDKKIKNLNKK